MAWVTTKFFLNCRAENFITTTSTEALEDEHDHAELRTDVEQTSMTVLNIKRPFWRKILIKQLQRYSLFLPILHPLDTKYGSSSSIVLCSIHSSLFYKNFIPSMTERVRTKQRITVTRTLPLNFSSLHKNIDHVGSTCFPFSNLTSYFPHEKTYFKLLGILFSRQCIMKNVIVCP